MPSAWAVVLISLVAVGCRKRSTPPPPPVAYEDAQAPAVPVDVQVADLPLGQAELAGYGWRQRAGQPAFRSARAAEDRGDWATVVTTCREALALDPGHLEASWLLASALGHLGQLDQVLAPLQRAVTGDFGTWGVASLRHPALAAFYATTQGAAWRHHVEEDRERYVAMLQHAVIVTVAGDLYAVDVQTRRWHRLTRTQGLVIGGLYAPDRHQLAYVTRGRPPRRELGIGVVDVQRGQVTRPQPLGTPGPITVVHHSKPSSGFWIGAGKRLIWRQLVDGRLRPLPAKSRRPRGPWLEVTRTSSRHHGLPVAAVTADWDDDGLAGALRIGASKRVVAAPSPAMIDGNTATWSTGRSHLAFVAQLDETCTEGSISSAAYVAEATTGKLVELERAVGGLAVAWVTERKLAVAGDHGVSIVDLDGAPVAIPGATNLVTPRRRVRCNDAEGLLPPLTEDQELAESPVIVEPDDGPVVGPR